MLHLTRWQSAPALFVTVGILSSAIAPLAVSNTAIAQPTVAPLMAQTWSNSYRSTIPAGTQVPVRLNQSGQLVVPANETRSATLIVPRNVWSTTGEILIPQGTQVQGRLVPVRQGSQFVASSLRFSNGTVTPITATSNVIPITQATQQSGVNSDAVWKGSAIGAGTATLISGLAGNRRITIPKVLVGAGAGALGGVVFGRRGATDAVVINPGQDLTLTVNRTLTVR